MRNFMSSCHFGNSKSCYLLSTIPHGYYLPHTLLPSTSITVLAPAWIENRSIITVEIKNLASLEMSSFYIIAHSFLKSYEIKLFAKIFNSWKPLTIFEKSYILDGCLVLESIEKKWGIGTKWVEIINGIEKSFFQAVLKTY